MFKNRRRQDLYPNPGRRITDIVIPGTDGFRSLGGNRRDTQ